MAIFSDVKKIIAGLNKEEIRLAKKYLNFNQRDADDTLLTKLFLKVIENPNLDSDSARLFMKESVSAFEKLCSRLVEKLNYMVVSEFNMTGKSPIAYKTRREWELQTKLLLAQIQLARGNTDLSITFLNEAVTIGVDIEDYSELVKLMRLKIRILTIRGEKKVFEQAKDKIQYYQQCAEILERSKEQYIKLMTDAHSQTSLFNIETWEQELTKFIHYYEFTNSNYIQYQYLELMQTYCILKNNYSENEKYAYQLLKLVKNVPLLNKQQFLGIANLFVSQANLYVSNYDLASQYCILAREHFSRNTYNYFLTEELEFYINYYSNEFDKAEKAIYRIKRNEDYCIADSVKYQIEFLLAACLFAKKEYNEAQRVLLKINLIQQEKVSWNFAMRTLQAMIYIETDSYDDLLRHLSTYERDIMRVQKKQQVRKREILIWKLFNTWAKTQSFSETIELRKEELSLMQTNEAEYCWQKHGHELVAVDKWFFIKANAEKKTKSGISKGR
jgi:hypothetical protein